MTEAEGATPDRQVAAAVLHRVTAGAYADRAFSGEARRAELTGPSRAKAHRLVFGVVQRQRTLDWLIDPHLDRPDAVESDVRDILRLGAFELGWSDSVRPATAVDQAVRLAKGLAGVDRRRAARAGLVNAVLRRLGDIPERLAELDDSGRADLGVLHSMPDWIVRHLCDALGEAVGTQVLAAANQPAESNVRWNALRGDRDAFERLLPPDAVRDSVFEDAYLLPGAFALEESPIWTDGRGMAQSRASMIPVLALDPAPGERILDLCSAPGTKATYLAARTGGTASITCVELHPARTRTLEAIARRMGADLTIMTGDAREVELDGMFDAVLVDPPCTGLGVLSQRPDARWRRDEGDIAELAKLQREILDRACSVCAPGGRVVYSTCTLLPEENEHVVTATGWELEDLTQRYPQYTYDPLPGALLTIPGRDGTDGFFVARLRAPNR